MSESGVRPMRRADMLSRRARPRWWRATPSLSQERVLKVSLYSRPMSLRAKLALWTVLVFGVIFVAFEGMVFLYQRASVDDFFARRLATRFELIKDEVGRGAPRFDAGDLALAAHMDGKFVMLERVVVCLFDQHGKLITSTDSSYIPPDVDLASVGARDALTTSWSSSAGYSTDPRGARYARAIAQRIEGVDGKKYILLLAAEDSYFRQLVAPMFWTFLLTVPLMIGIVGIAAWFVAGVALLPLRRAKQALEGLSPETVRKPLRVRGETPELREIVEEVERARVRMESGFTAQERFIANVSHELKTPIATVMAEAEVMDLSAADPELRGFVRSVRAEMKRLGTMVDSFLLLTRVGAGKALVKMRTCLVNELILDSANACALMGREYKVSLEPILLESEADVDLCVAGDAGLLGSMIDNLVRNAIRFTPERGTVRIEARRAGDSVVIDVTDEGAGIPEDVLRRLFDRFVQAPQEERLGRGHGLGLQIAQGVAELHGGTITVRNLTPRGARFSIHLPVAGKSAQTGGKPDQPTPAAVAAAQRIGDAKEAAQARAQVSQRPGARG